MKRLLLALSLALSLVSAASSAQATIIVFGESLSGPAESPPNASPGTGLGTQIVDTGAHTLHILISFQDLLDQTTASHIHCCTAAPFAGTAGVATAVPSFAGFPLGVTSGSFDDVLDLTQAGSFNPAFIVANGRTPASAEQALIAGMLAGRSYLNIHTVSFPGGEIRGFLQLVAVPEPAPLALLGLALLVLAVVWWWTRD